MSKVAIVTGANQGLGLALVEGLCRALGSDAVVYLTARDPIKGEAACARLHQAGLGPAFLQLDVTDPRQIEDGAALLAQRHGGVDILISNAGARIVPDRAQNQQVGAFVATNNLGLSRLLTDFGPRMRGGGHVVVVASAFGTLHHLPPALHSMFDAPGQTLEALDAIMAGYVSLVERDEAQQHGWPDWINIASKVGQVAAMRTFARTMTGRELSVTAACPGLVDTEASRPWFGDMSRAQTPAEAAKDLVWLATAPPPESVLQGQLVQHRRILPWRPG